MIHPCNNPGCRGRHWTHSGAEACYRRFVISRRPAETSASPRPHGPNPWQQRQLEAQRRREHQELEDHLAQHLPSPSANALAHANGERQLRFVNERFHTVSALTSDRLYRLNRQLRSGVPQEVDDTLTMIIGFDSYADFESSAAEVFDTLGAEVRLDGGPITVYRGTRTDTHDFSTWLPGQTTADAGYLFAALDDDTARRYMGGREWERGPEEAPALLKLEVHSALVIPDPAERSLELSRATFPQVFLRNAIAQIVIPPALNKWHVEELRVGPYLYAEATQL